jgi:hypothetical protein
MHIFCTLFDENYLANFLALHESLCKEDEMGFIIYAFCMDEKSFLFINSKSFDGFNNIVAISIKQLLEKYNQLIEIKRTRSIVEFYFTCSPFICSFVFESNPSIEQLTYLDADLLFFKSPEYIFKEMGEASISIIEHKFYGWGKKYEKYGKYNVGWVSFKNDFSGRACLNKWRLDCQEWCFDYYDIINERFGDQKYLDKWGSNFNGVKTISQKGANLAPWNAGQYKIWTNFKKEILVDDDYLIFYHFASFKKIASDKFTTNLSRYFARPNFILKFNIYYFYLQKIIFFNKKISQFFSNDENLILKKNRKLVDKSSLGIRLSNIYSSVLRHYYADFIKDKM